MKRGGDDPAARGKRRRAQEAGRAARSPTVVARPQRADAGRNADPRSSRPTALRRAAEEAPGLRGLPEEVVQSRERNSRAALQDELLNSRATRREAERSNDRHPASPADDEGASGTLCVGAGEVEGARVGQGCGADWRSMVGWDRLIETSSACARRMTTGSRWRTSSRRRWATRPRWPRRPPPPGGAPPRPRRRAPRRRAGRRRRAARAWRGTAEKITASSAQVGIPEEIAADIAAFERAYAETGNPLYVWDALSLLCVPLYVPCIRPEFMRGAFLPGWCVEYLGRVAEAHPGAPAPQHPPPGRHRGAGARALEGLGAEPARVGRLRGVAEGPRQGSRTPTCTSA